MPKGHSTVLLAFLFIAVASVHPQARGAAQDERTRFLTLVHKLEQSPLDLGLRRERTWAIGWALRKRGPHAQGCRNPMSGYYAEPKYIYDEEIVTQLTLSSVAFSVEHPNQSGDVAAEAKASIESALKAYGSILKGEPTARSIALDELAQEQSQGRLENFVREQCGVEKQPSRPSISAAVTAPATPPKSGTTAATPAPVVSDVPTAPPASTPRKPARKQYTPENRQKLLAVVHKLESTPLDESMRPDREWAEQWVVADQDIHLKICTSLLVELRRPRYKYRSELSSQLLLSSAAFALEHSDRAGDGTAQNIGGMEGVLKAYSAILKADPAAHAKSLDDLLQKQRQGKLADAVRTTLQSCGQ